MKRRLERRGIFLAEALLGTMLAAAILGVVIVAVNGQARVAAKMAVKRDAIHRVEAAMLAMQSKNLPASAVNIRMLPTTAPAGWKWAEVSNKQCTLLGLIPEKANQEGRP